MDEEAIMNLIRERGYLRYSTIMIKFHISSREAIEIVENYKKKGIIDENGRYDKKTKCTWRRGDAAKKLCKDETFIDPFTLLKAETVPQKDDTPIIETTLSISSDMRTEEKALRKMVTKKKKQYDLEGQLSFFD